MPLRHAGGLFLFVIPSRPQPRLRGKDERESAVFGVFQQPVYRCDISA
jgi:hypothetical protein